MDYGAIVSDAAGYAKTALVKNPITWLIFIICGLPLALIRFVFDPKTIFTGTTIHWDLIPWPRLVALCCAGLLLSFIVSGYLVRVYRGTTPPPRFDSWCSLYLDGIKLAIVGFLWFVPALIIFVAALAFMFFGVHGSASMGTMMGAGFILILIGLIVLVITCLYAVLGSVRFARTGSMREGLRFSAITGTIQAIGVGYVHHRPGDHDGACHPRQSRHLTLRANPVCRVGYPAGAHADHFGLLRPVHQPGL